MAYQSVPYQGLLRQHPASDALFNYANLVMREAHGNCGDSNPWTYPALRRADGRGGCHAERGPGTILRLPGPERGGQIHNHQDADRAAGAERWDDCDSGPPLRGRGVGVEAADRRGAGGDGADGPTDGARVSALCWTHVRAGLRYHK